MDRYSKGEWLLLRREAARAYCAVMTTWSVACQWRGDSGPFGGGVALAEQFQKLNSKGNGRGDL